jgi:hypothetical protein
MGGPHLEQAEVRARRRGNCPSGMRWRAKSNQSDSGLSQRLPQFRVLGHKSTKSIAVQGEQEYEDNEELGRIVKAAADHLTGACSCFHSMRHRVDAFLFCSPRQHGAADADRRGA